MIQKHHKSPRLRLSAGLSAVLFALVILLTDSEMALPCLLAAAFHECGHLFAAKTLGIRLSEMKLDLFGARISVPAGSLSYRHEFLLCAAGPFFSFLLFLLLSFPHSFRGGFPRNLCDSSLFLGILNLLPVRGFDGGRMLSAVLSEFISPFAAETAEKLFTGLFLILLWGISVYLLLVTSGGLILFVFSTGLFAKVFLS